MFFCLFIKDLKKTLFWTGIKIDVFQKGGFSNSNLYEYLYIKTRVHMYICMSQVVLNSPRHRKLIVNVTSGLQNKNALLWESPHWRQSLSRSHHGTRMRLTLVSLTVVILWHWYSCESQDTPENNLPARYVSKCISSYLIQKSLQVGMLLECCWNMLLLFVILLYCYIV